MRGVMLYKFQNNKNVESLKFETFQEVSDFIWGELKGMKRFNFSYSSEKNGWRETITHFKLKDHNIVYVIKNKKSLLKKNMLIMGEIMESREDWGQILTGCCPNQIP
jgi:hypothetical protein|tara:strand:- start:4 stop:324 length:321 start_codon:yes stop_codon:yes gene_type:complete